MKKMLKRKSKGFTLVELLIVIIIIGILAGMMMLSTGAATDKAEATKIVSNLRNIKAGVIMYYADHTTWPSSDAAMTSSSAVAAYVDQVPTGYSILNDNTNVWVKATGANTLPTWTATSGIHSKLTDMVTASGITVSGDVVTMKVK